VNISNETNDASRSMRSVKTTKELLEDQDVHKFIFFSFVNKFMFSKFFKVF